MSGGSRRCGEESGWHPLCLVLGAIRMPFFNDVELEFVDEGEVFHASSHVLGMASPVFLAMLESDMTEGKTKRIKVLSDIGCLCPAAK